MSKVHTVLHATKQEHTAFTPSYRALSPFGRYSLHLPTEGWSGWVDLNDWLDGNKFPASEFNPDTVTHPSINRARSRTTLLMWSTPLPTATGLNSILKEAFFETRKFGLLILRRRAAKQLRCGGHCYIHVCSPCLEWFLIRWLCWHGQFSPEASF